MLDQSASAVMQEIDTQEMQELGAPKNEGANEWGPKIRGPLPGPKARAIVDADDRYMSPSYTRSYPLVAKRGHVVNLVPAGDGAWRRDPDTGVAFVLRRVEP